LEEEKKEKDIIDEDVLSTSQQSQPEYIYSSSSSVKPSFAPKLRRSYSQQLKKMSKSPRLSFIQPKIQPQAQDNFSRNSNVSNRLSTMSSNSIVNSPSGYKLFRQSIQNYSNNNKKVIDSTPINFNNTNNSNFDCSSVPVSPVAILKRNANHCHKNSASSINCYNFYDGNDRSLINPECNKFVQSESTIMNLNNPNRLFKTNPLEERNSIDFINKTSMDYINKNSIDYINKNSMDHINKNSMEFMNKNSMDYVNKNSMEFINKNSMEFINKNSMEFINKNSTDYINENSSLLINLCISGSNNVKTSSTTSIGKYIYVELLIKIIELFNIYYYILINITINYMINDIHIYITFKAPSYNSKSSKLKNSIQDESIDNQFMIASTSDYGKETDDNEYFSGKINIFT